MKNKNLIANLQRQVNILERRVATLEHGIMPILRIGPQPMELKTDNGERLKKIIADLIKKKKLKAPKKRTRLTK